MKYVIFLPLFAGLLSAAAHAADRVALVIGNNAYQNGAPLKNPINDAKAVAGALKAAGFEVMTAEDAGLETMEKKVVEFSRAAKGAKAAWFYYSGHGAEVKGTNYLIPVDAAVQEEFQVKHKTLALDQVLSAMDEAGAPLKVVVLDCCRDNPFGKSWSRSGTKGLAQIGETPRGTVIAFATAPGKTAADGSGQNSPYTTALVQALATPGLEVDQVFKQAGKNVLTATSQQQQPWVNSSFFDSFILNPNEQKNESPESVGRQFMTVKLDGADKNIPLIPAEELSKLRSTSPELKNINRAFRLVLTPKDVGKKIQGITFEARNDFGVNSVFYDKEEGSVFALKSDSGWFRSHEQLLDMFELPAEYVKGRRAFTGGKTGYPLPSGQSVQWTEMKPDVWFMMKSPSKNNSEYNPVFILAATAHLFFSKDDPATPQSEAVLVFYRANAK